jgi:hypothetical protein
MKKIVELLINHDLLEDDNLTGVDTVSLVDNPAIGYEWFAFNAEGNLPAYTDEDCEECKTYSSFESIDDYPQTIKDAAAKGIRLNEEQGNKCATQTGKVRAQQLAQGKPISEETIARMYSYLSRAEVYYDASDETACGTISYLLWGGPAALEWSRKRLERLQQDLVSEELMTYFNEVGEEYEPTNSTFVQSEKFAANDVTIADVTDAISALGLLKGKRDANEVSKIVYRYEGPNDSRTRKFCKSLLNLSQRKVFTEDEINELPRRSSIVRDGVIPKAGTSANDYDLFKYAAGANCRHRFVQYKMFKDPQTNRTLFIQTGVETTRGKDHGVQDGNMGGYTSQKALDKAKQTAAIKYNMMDFATMDEDQQVVVAPAMVPETLIKRLDENGMEYYVYFSKDTIKKIAEKFFAKNYHNNTDINHDGEVTQANTLLESWIVEDPEKDKSSLYGFNVPEGTWMLSMRINDDETWKKIKAGALRGYSISGVFAVNELLTLVLILTGITLNIVRIVETKRKAKQDK